MRGSEDGAEQDANTANGDVGNAQEVVARPPMTVRVVMTIDLVPL